jgi:ketosteroid isomerase-like protein
MSLENVELVRKGYQALNDGGVEAILPFIDPDFEMEVPPEVSPEPQIVRGHEGVRLWFESAYEALDEIRIEPEEFIDAGRRVIVPVRMIGTGRGSGIKAEQQVTQVWTLRNGRAVRMSSYVDKESALEAAGVSEQDAHADLDPHGP